MLLTTTVAALALGGVALAPASAKQLEEPPAQESAAEQAEASLEQSEDADEQAEATTALAEDGPFTFRATKAAEEYPAYASKIEHIREVIAAVKGRVLKLLELPVGSHMRKKGLPVKRARIREEREHLREVRMKLRAKKVAARERAAARK